jgi:hypothetical protein
VAERVEVIGRALCHTSRFQILPECSGSLEAIQDEDGLPWRLADQP